MAYHVTVTNAYHEAIRVFGTYFNARDTRPARLPPTLGHGMFQIPGLGPLNFTDLGQKNVGGHSKKTWGVLLSYQGEEVVFRYEGEGELRVDINELGQAELSGNGEFSRVQLSSFIIKKKDEGNVISGNT